MRGNWIFFAAFLFAAFLFAGCGSPSDPVTGGTERYKKADERDLLNTAQWIFDSRLKGLSSNEHFVIDAVFVQREGKITLHSHFNGYKWRDGVQTVFKRNGDGVTLQVVVPGYAAKEAELPAGFVTPEGRLKARVEIHNGGASGVRVLVWKYNVSIQGEVQNPRPYIDAANAEFDSRELGWVFHDHGRGVQWGVEFENARVDGAHREAPYAE